MRCVVLWLFHVVLLCFVLVAWFVCLFVCVYFGWFDSFGTHIRPLGCLFAYLVVYVCLFARYLFVCMSVALYVSLIACLFARSRDPTLYVMLRMLV